MRRFVHVSAVFTRRLASGGKFAGTNKPRKYRETTTQVRHALQLLSALGIRHSSTCQRIDCASVCRGENLMSIALLYVWFTCSPTLASRSMVRSQREKKARCASLRWPTCPQPSHPTDHKTQKMVWAQHGIKLYSAALPLRFRNATYLLEIPEERRTCRLVCLITLPAHMLTLCALF